MRVGILHSGALGDSVLALHLVRAIVEGLRGALPPGVELDVTAVARSPAWRLAAQCGIIRRVLDFESHGIHTLFAPPPAAVDNRLMEWLRGLDLVVSLCGLADEPPASRIRCESAARVYALDPRLRAETAAARRHITEQWRSDLIAQGLRVAAITSAPLFALWTPGQDARRSPGSDVAVCCCETTRPGNETQERPARPVALLHPGSGGRTKCWPLDRFERLAAALRSGFDVRWILGPAEEEWLVGVMPARLRATGPVRYEESLEGLVGAIRAASVYVGNDTGPTHVAAALGCPAVAVFGPTDPAVWGPIGQRVRTVRGGGSSSSEWGADIADVLQAIQDLGLPGAADTADPRP